MNPAGAESERVHPGSVPDGEPTLSRRAFFDRVLGMFRVAALLAVLAAVLLGGVVPAGAHPRPVELLASAAPPTVAVSDVSSVLHAAGGLEESAMFWPIVLAVFLGSAVLAGRRSPRLVVVALVVVLAAFGVETAVHSVHHAFDDGAVACPAASIAEHLDGTTIDGLAVDVPRLYLGTISAASGPDISPLSSLDPPHGRAPPSALV